ncbi:MAG: hypothetical protein OHK0031_06590 [Anaerolineales bacterium]
MKDLFPASLHFFLAYLLGVALAHYLGVPLSLSAFGLGLAWLMSLFAAAAWLDDAFRNPAQPFRADDSLEQRLKTRQRRLLLGLAALTLSAALTVTMAALRLLNLSALTLMALTALALLALTIPPVRLSNRGLGEFALALAAADLTPALAFALQNGALHRLLAAFVFPLTFLALAYFFAITFPTLARDQKYGRQTFLARFGWQIAVPAHNAFLAAAYLLLTAAPFFGVPFGLIWPGLLTLPLAALQIYQFLRLENGEKPLWPLLNLTAAAIPGLTAYLLAFTLWIR